MPLRLALLLIVASVSLIAQTVSPIAPAVSVGGSITLTSSAPTTWTLSGVGTCTGCGVAGTSSITYTAPASVVPSMTMGGVQILPNDSIFATPITALPVHANSSAWTAFLTAGITLQPGWGENVATSSTPLKTIKPYYGDDFGNWPSYNVPFPGYETLNIENGAYISEDNPNSDHHTMVVNRSTSTFYEWYNELKSATGAPFSSTYTCQDSSSGCNVQGVTPPWTATTFKVASVSGSQSDLPLTAVSWTLADIKAGPKHATSFTLASHAGCLWPSNNFGSACGTPTTANAPYGARFRLKSSVNATTICTDSGTLNQDCYNILTGLATYGMILTDNGGGGQINVFSEVSKDPITRRAAEIIRAAGLTGSSFEAVDESALQETAANGFQLPYALGSYAVDPGNGTVTPSNYALVTAGSTKVSIAIQGVAIGQPSNTLAIAQGMGAYALPTWVTPAVVSQTVTWAKTSSTCSGDSISGTSYVSPTSGAPCRAVLTATAAADSNVHAVLYVSVFASSGSGVATGYRFDVASLAGNTTTDSGGLTWYNDFGLQIGGQWSYPNGSYIPGAAALDYPAWVDGAGSPLPEAQQYETIVYTYGGDMTFCAAVPNGNYKVRWGYGQQWNNAASAPQANKLLSSALALNPYHIVNQGVIAAHFVDWMFPINYRFATPSDFYTPAIVSNNLLCTSSRDVGPSVAVTTTDGVAPNYWVNGSQLWPNFVYSAPSVKDVQAALLELIPDSSAAHWAIDTQGATRIAPGQSIQLWAIDWYTGDTDISSPTWSIVSDRTGLASISSTGLLTLSSGTPLDYQPIVVKVQGTSHSATLTLYSVGNSRLIQ